MAGGLPKHAANIFQRTAGGGRKIVPSGALKMGIKTFNTRLDYDTLLKLIMLKNRAANFYGKHGDEF